MYSLIALSILVLVISGGVEGQECSDCMNYVKCPEAVSRAVNERNNITLQLFRDTGCGYERGTRMPKVCCSKFQQEAEDIRISNHPNLGLLPKRCGEINDQRIIGGKQADPYEFPWMALIARSLQGPQFTCGGSIINERYILTAAHCVFQRRIEAVRIGEYEINPKNEPDCYMGACVTHKDFEVELSVVHEEYNQMLVTNDIALLRLTELMDFQQDNIYPICLPKTAQLRNKPLAYQTATVAGWGFTEAYIKSSILLKVDIPIVTVEDCRNFYNRHEGTDKKLCAGTIGKDSCGGDSGGPLMVKVAGTSASSDLRS
ncbi:CLIP domain-containing serine protease HP8-like isoform X3 [Epargyreus clarus]|uniref:CLIP domain-containing serine protease HP8-like isoform X3 n=1 Tax=Epargyreus clarus TaxID=520877 RepID=UPI003C2F68D7